LPIVDFLYKVLYNDPINRRDTMADTQSKRDKRDTTQAAIIAMVGDWESSCRLDFIEDLLNELDDEALAKVAEQQGVDL